MRITKIIALITIAAAIIAAITLSTMPASGSVGNTQNDGQNDKTERGDGRRE